MRTTHTYLKGTTMFTDVANPFGVNAFEPVVVQIPTRTLYYRGMRLDRTLDAIKRGPKPLSHCIRDFLLNYNG